MTTPEITAIFFFITILRILLSNYLSMGKVFIFFCCDSQRINEISELLSGFHYWKRPRPSEIKSKASKNRKANPSWSTKIVYRVRKVIFVLTFFFRTREINCKTYMHNRIPCVENNIFHNFYVLFPDSYIHEIIHNLIIKLFIFVSRLINPRKLFRV